MEIQRSYKIELGPDDIDDMIKYYIYDKEDINLESIVVIPMYDEDGKLTLKIEGES